MKDAQSDIEVKGEVVARVGRQNGWYILYALDQRLRDIDQQRYRSIAEAREAALITLDQFSREV